ncbi:TetR/AcrR family transcriptional regulator C-terminal domain-containing protein [Anaerolentibacter hominis]|uniref:TetR/AcrR family transcriptional regulator C-terminal domain-containing protein n=1 Tax=Anaerolentibacter hominis TaxID=3079009 RepID=UPI0031B80703
MASSELTIQAIVQAVKTLMRKRPIDRLSISDITRECGLSRNTLYYHFRDKYEIVEWIFEQEIKPVIKPLLTEDTWVESLAVLTDRMKEDQDFYTNAVKNTGANSFVELLTRLYKEFLMETAQQNAAGIMDTRQQELAARFYSHGIIGMLTDWVAFGMKQDVREANQVIAAAIGNNIFRKQKPVLDSL